MNETSYERSEGHLAFILVNDRHWEYFVIGDQVYRQLASAPVMPDGRRSGRWYCPLWQWNQEA